MTLSVPTADLQDNGSTISRILELLDNGKHVVCIIEKTRDIGVIRDLITKKPGGLLVIAASPSVAWHLEKHQIPFSSIDRYIRDDDIVVQGMENFSLVHQLCDETDEILKSKDPVLRTYGLNPALDNFFYIKSLFDGLCLRLQILNTIVSMERPDAVVTFSQEPVAGEAIMIKYPFQPDERVFGLIVPVVSPLGISLPSPPPSGLHHESRPTTFHDLNHFPAGVRSFLVPITQSNFLYSLKYFGILPSLRLLAFSIRNRLKDSRRLLVLGYGYNWDYMLLNLYREGFCLFHYRKGQEYFHTTGSTGDGDLEKVIRPVAEKYCRYQGTDFSGLFLERFIPMVQNSIRNAPAATREFKKELMRVSPCAILCAVKENFFDHLPAHVGRHHNIPVISWQHGDQGLRERVAIAIFTELMNTDVHFGFGAGVQESLEHDPLNRFPCMMENTGSFELEQLYNDRHEYSVEFPVLYVTTNYFSNNLFINSASVMKDNDFWETQKLILSTLGRSGIPAVFKLHPGDYGATHFEDYIRTMGYTNITVMRGERSFTDLVRHAGVVIIDFPSTTLLQALAAHKKVFVLLKHTVMTRSAQALVQKCAVCADTPQQLGDLLRKYWNHEPLESMPDWNNDEFLKYFGIHEPDGNVSGRAIRLLDRICKNTRPKP